MEKFGQSLSHPQCVVNGVLFLILGDHQCEGVCPCAGQPHLGQVVWAVDADAIDVRRGVRCGRSQVSLFIVKNQRAADSVCQFSVLRITLFKNLLLLCDRIMFLQGI